MIDTHFLHFQEFNNAGNDFNPNHFAMNGKKKFQIVHDFRDKKTIRGFYIEKAK